MCELATDRRSVLLPFVAVPVHNHIMKIMSIIIVAVMAIPAMTGSQPMVVTARRHGHQELRPAGNFWPIGHFLG